nr:MAG TPA: hypothetical protein [Caudoviricetes sp.]
MFQCFINKYECSYLPYNSLSVFLLSFIIVATSFFIDGKLANRLILLYCIITLTFVRFMITILR